MGVTVRCKFNYGQVVYVKTDINQDPRQVIGVQGTADGGMLIKLTIDGDASWHYECEISEEKDVMLAMSN
jgi:N-formylglutamate amidohydrolase